MNFSIIYILFFILSSCVSIERDIYFRNKDSNDGKNISSTRPGSNFLYSPVKVTNQYDRSINISISNYAEGSYLWGFIIPVIPVFFLPQMKFSLDKNEHLKIRCQVGAHFGPPYLKKWEHAGSRELYVLNDKGLELSEKIKNSKDSCASVSISLADGKNILPISTEIDDKSMISILTFDVPAGSLSEFSINVSEIKISTGEKIKTNVKFNAVIEDWTRYYLVPVAP